MALLGMDLGGTKLASAIFSIEGDILCKDILPLQQRKGREVGALITSQINKMLDWAKAQRTKITSIGISVPGISHIKSQTVWAPNIPGWDDYPLLKEVQAVTGNIPVSIHCDRACYISGELWKGNAQGCKDAIFLAVGTGIGAGIVIDGRILHGAHDISGAIGWMALNKPFEDKYVNCGCFEHYASGSGIAAIAQKMLQEQTQYQGVLKAKSVVHITAHDVFAAYHQQDSIAFTIMQQCIEYWGMAIANLISLLNPEKILLGGGVFGPAVQFIPAIKKEAAQWAQPVSMQQVSIEASALGGEAGVYGAGYLALKNLHPQESIT